jgi:hypothetical protein
MIDINELRTVIQEIGLNGVCLAEINELLDRLEVAEKDIALKERVIDSLGSELNAVANERDALRTRITAMERQRPVRFVFKSDELDEQIKLAIDPIWAEAFEVPEGMVPLYALPGAKGEKK